MGNSWAGLAAAALLAAAFFLPAALSQWGDRRLLDEPHITRQDEEREGFAESLQLSVAEKLFLLRSGSAVCVADSAGVPGMVDATSGGSVNGGGALQVNHLYLMPAPAGVRASSEAAVLVRGGYSVR